MDEDSKDPCVAIKTMKLYSEPGQLVKNEIKATGETDPEKIAMMGHLHYNGTAALDKAIEALFGSAEPAGTVLDVGAGLGSSGRYLALKCPKLKVHAMELQPDLVKDGKEITATCGVEDQVKHTTGDITDGIVSAGPYDGAISILVILHIDDKETVFKNLSGSLKPGAKIFIEDFVMENDIKPEEWKMLQEDVYCSKLTTKEEYTKLVEAAGFKNVKVERMTENWKSFVRSR